MTRIVFRADGGRAIGAGHVMRCLALASVFSEGGWQVAFAVSGETKQSISALAHCGYEVAVLPDNEADEEEAAILAGLWPAGMDILVVDHYGRGAPFQRACRPWVKRIAVIDDLADRPHDADVLIDSGAESGSLYRSLLPGSASVLIGPRFAIVHPAFRAARKSALVRRDGRPVARVLVSFGQVDVPNATAAAVAALEAAGFDDDVDVVLGSAAPHLADVREKAGKRVRLHVDADDMVGLMSAADLAIGAGGGTAWERCCVGLPAILVEIAENQRGIIAAVLGGGAGMNAGAVDAGLATRVGERLSDMLRIAELRIEMAKRGVELVDGRGAERILFAIVGEHSARDGSGVVLRSAEYEDEDWLLELQRKPETRRYFRNPKIPSPDEHRRWFRQTLDSPERMLTIIEVAGAPAGTVRLDRLNPSEAPRYEVSIVVDPRFQRRGVGTAALSLVRQCLPGAVIDATVIAQNASSSSLFRSAGYEYIGSNRYRNFPPVTGGQASWAQ